MGIVYNSSVKLAFVDASIAAVVVGFDELRFEFYRCVEVFNSGVKFTFFAISHTANSICLGIISFEFYRCVGVFNSIV